MHFVFIIDPFAKLDSVDEDTSCVLIQECLRRQHQVFCAHVAGLDLDAGRPTGTVRQVLARRGSCFHLAPVQDIRLDDVQVVFMRKDPPVGLHYLHALQILQRIWSRTLVVNSPTGMSMINEKLYPLDFPELVPRSIVTCRSQRLLAFQGKIAKQVVVKPLHECSGRGIVLLQPGAEETSSLAKSLTADGARFVLAQEFLPAVYESGDKRVLLLDGEPIGTMRRLPKAGEYRSNLHQGGRCVHSQLDDIDRAICERVSPGLSAAGIYLAGLDIIDGRLIEVNVTSPAGIPEINGLCGRRLERVVVDWAEQEALSRQAS